MEMPDRMIAALRVAGIRERIGHQSSHSTLVDDDVHVFDEIGRGGTAVASHTGEFAGLHDIEERLELARTETMDAFGIDDGAVGEDLEEHPELGAVIGAAEGE